MCPEILRCAQNDLFIRASIASLLCYNSEMVQIRPIREGEEQAFFDLMSAMDHENEFMLYEPGERPRNLEALERKIRASVEGRSLLLVAEDDGELAGYYSLDRGGVTRNRHFGYVVIGIRAAYQGKGLGKQFFATGEAWARSVGITRLELTVMTHNIAGVRLYLGAGFVVEGHKQRALKVKGKYVDEYYMGKLL